MFLYMNRNVLFLIRDRGYVLNSRSVGAVLVGLRMWLWCNARPGVDGQNDNFQFHGCHRNIHGTRENAAGSRACMKCTRAVAWKDDKIWGNGTAKFKFRTGGRGANRKGRRRKRKKGSFSCQKKPNFHQNLAGGMKNEPSLHLGYIFCWDVTPSSLYTLTPMREWHVKWK